MGEELRHVEADAARAHDGHRAAHRSPPAGEGALVGGLVRVLVGDRCSYSTRYLPPTTLSLHLPTPPYTSPLPAPSSQLPTPYSLLPTPYSLLPAPRSVLAW